MIIGFNETLRQKGYTNKKLLYHYTNIQALFDIIETKKIRLSCPYYLNDESEIRYGINLIKRLLKQLSLDIDNAEKIKSSISILEEVQHFFIFSLSRHENLLSQWRGYTKINTGVCIGFDEDNLRKRAALNGIDLIECVYDGAKQLEILKGVVENILEKQSNGEKNLVEIPELISLLSKIKNGSFREEGEYRLVSKYFPQMSAPEIKYRATEKFILPFIELDIAGLESDDYLFDQIIIGPCNNHDLAFSSLSNYLFARKACRKILTSAIPLR